jgi:HAE1 family hydrophobic/amphiphilic exporter-1
MLKTFIETCTLDRNLNSNYHIRCIGIDVLTVEQYPEIAPPTVQVTANYTGPTR